MSPRVPEAIRQAWGDEVLTEFVPWLEQTIEEKTLPRLEQMVAEKAVPGDEYRQVLSRLDVLEHDVADIKENGRELRREMRSEIGEMRGEIGSLRDEMRGEISGLRDEMNRRFIEMERHFEDRFDQMNCHFEVRLDQMSERMLVQTRWLIGTLTLFGTIITILLAIAQFTP